MSILGSASMRQPKLEQGPEVWRSHLCSSRTNQTPGSLEQPPPTASPTPRGHSMKEETSPFLVPSLHSPTAAGRSSFSWLRLPCCAEWGQCLWAPGTPRQGSPPRHSHFEQWSPGMRLASVTRPASLRLRSFCWEICKTEVALLR